MADTNDLARARDALTAPADVLDTSLLGAVHDGLLSVPAEPTALPGTDDEAPRLAVRRRTGF
ncbi:hypothetical protein Q9R32_12260 [Actinotalea sp. AC32]|nr:hypothetical protein [Actinotalea sp. AC32]